MTRSTWRVNRVVFMCGLLLVSGLLLGSARASDPTHLARLIKTRSCAGCDLSGADLSGFGLPKSDLSGANLTGAKLYKATLTNANLTDANLTGADLTGANLSGATGAVLSVAKTTATTTCPEGYAGPCGR
jgi:uncharacterized protein YjbI with pentapeptide repeats